MKNFLKNRLKQFGIIKKMSKLKVPETKAEEEKFTVFYKGEAVSVLNARLAIKQNLDFDDIQKIKGVHIKLLELFDEIKNEQDPVKLKELASQIEDIEYELQDAWKFERDSRFHSWWFQAPKCECPYLDNLDLIGSGQRIISAHCPLFGA